MSSRISWLVIVCAQAVVACGDPEGGDGVDAGARDAAPDAAGPRLTTLAPEVESERAGFGYTMATNSIDTLVVGATAAPGRVGAAYVFLHRPDGWDQQAKLVGDATAKAFAERVAISENTIAVSERMPGATQDASDAMRVRVFTRSGVVWREAAILKPAEPSAGFAASLAVQGDTIVVGDSGRIVNNQHVDAAARVFVREGDAWIERASLVPTAATPSYAYATAVAIDGERIVVGDHSARSPSDTPVGQAYVFERTGGAWQHRTTLAPQFGNVIPHDTDFGVSVAMRGNRLVIGEDDTCATAHVYDRTASEWAHVIELDPDHNVCGTASPRVSIGFDKVVVAAPGKDDAEPLFRVDGAGYIFGTSATGWAEVPEAVRPMDATSAGSAAVLTADELILGAPASGTVYVWRL
ncbi:MAG TPA: hypothetical protein VM261_25160 [Kofleriaceae bacterium]|nr:hypothetical protein [Kofleriaceae bacterium]